MNADEPGAAAEILVIGAGQAGLSAAYHLRRLGLAPGTAEPGGFIVLDQAPGPGGAWQFRWPSLTLTTVNGVHDLPGMAFSEVLGPSAAQAPAAREVPRYYREYERRFGLAVRRPVSVQAVCGGEGTAPFRVETGTGTCYARGLINATGTWDRPFIPHYPGAATFTGRQLHTQQYRGAAEFAGQRVVIIGGGISAVQILDEVSQVATTTWVTRSEPRFTTEPFTPEAGRAAVALVEQRVRAGLPPGSVVSVTGIPVDDRIRAAQARGVLHRLPMFASIEPTGVRWTDGSFKEVDVLLWCTGFRSALDHLAPLRLRGPGGGITMTGTALTEVAGHPRIHLVGYGPSASTIGANRAGRAAAVSLVRTLSAAGTDLS